MKHPIKPIAKLNELAANVPPVPAVHSTDSSSRTANKVPTAEEIIEKLKPYAGIVILSLQVAEIFTNDATDEKLESLIALLKTLQPQD